MFGIHDFSLFLAAGILLNLTPGSDTVYILGRSVAQGRGAGVASALGICVGSIFHTGRRRLGFGNSGYIGTRFQRYQVLGGAYLVFSPESNALDRQRLGLPSISIGTQWGGISPGRRRPIF
jgi:threonine/homoserine/homoserine lactone efflux protein